MKMTKSELKKMMKEVFEEVLEEYLSKKQITKTDKKMNESTREIGREMLKKRMMSEDVIRSPSPVQKQKEIVTKNNLQDKKQIDLVEQTARAIAGNDPQRAQMFANIFADTLINTIPEQVAGEGKNPEQDKEYINESQMNKLAEGDVSRWGAIAFGKK